MNFLGFGISPISTIDVITFQTFANILEWDVIVFRWSGLGFVPNYLNAKAIEQLRIVGDFCFELLVGILSVYVLEFGFGFGDVSCVLTVYLRPNTSNI